MFGFHILRLHKVDSRVTLELVFRLAVESNTSVQDVYVLVNTSTATWPRMHTYQDDESVLLCSHKDYAVGLKPLTVERDSIIQD